MRLRIALTLLALVGGPLAAEGVLRFLLFHPGPLAASWGAGLRDAGFYADPQVEDDYWRLRLRFRSDADQRRAPRHDARLGWTKRSIDPVTYAHPEAAEIGDRRPILLYGASYAACETEPEDCFEGLVERSDLGEEYCVLNYGTGGYGVGQVGLLMRESLALYADRDPVVALVLVADSDFARCALSFRSWPKPRFTVEDGALVEGDPVPASVEEYLRLNEPQAVSYAWRGVVRGLGLSDGLTDRLLGLTGKRRELTALITAHVASIRDAVAAEGLDSFILLAVSPRSLFGEPGAQEREVSRVFDELGVTWLSVRPYIEASPLVHQELFFVRGRGLNHPTAAGNEVIFQAFRDGLRMATD